MYVIPDLPEAEPRLRERYSRLVMAHLTDVQQMAAGLHALEPVCQPFAATQAAWRFYHNPAVSLPQLVQPLQEATRQALAQAGSGWGLVVHDWSELHYGTHRSKADRVTLTHHDDQGYELLSALVLDGQGQPLGVVNQEVRAADGLHSTRHDQPVPAASALDGLSEVLEHVEGLKLGPSLVHIVDREADSVAHYRHWSGRLYHWLVRADDSRHVRHADQELRLCELAQRLEGWQQVRAVEHHGRQVEQWVAQAEVVLERPAWRNRVVKGTRVHACVPGPALPVRLVICQLRDSQQQVLSQWLLLTNLPSTVDASTVALWYYYRWRIESFFKLLKQAGHQLESWQQESAAALARRLLIVSMSCVVVWHLARSQHPQAQPLRQLLVRLSGRQINRCRDPQGFTLPALLAGLGVLLPMLLLLEQYQPNQLRQMLQAVLPGLPFDTS